MWAGDALFSEVSLGRMQPRCNSCGPEPPGGMMKSRFKPLAVLVLLFTLVFQHSFAQDDYDEWLRWAELGPYQPEVEDWEAIHAAALDEPALLVYANTSNIFRAVDTLLEDYPGLNIEALDISGQTIIDRIVLEWDAGLRDV